MARSFAICLIFCLICDNESSAQAVRVTAPYSGQLRTDPDVGNVQGIQRYGRPLKTDPDQGEGFSYHVYPVAQYPQMPSEELPAPTRQLKKPIPPQQPVQVQGSSVQRADASTESIDSLQQQFDDISKQINENPTTHKFTPEQLKSKQDERQKLNDKINALNASPTAPANPQPIDPVNATGTAYFAPNWGNPYPPSFDWTEGIRNFPLPGTFGYSAPPSSPAAALSYDALRLQAISVSRGIDSNTGQPAYSTPEIYHQPLVQVKMRVVEVERGDSLEAGSILEYVSRHNGVPTLTSGQTANTLGQNVRTISRLPLADLASTAAAGTGSLVNITSEHINLLIQLLATEAKADVVTAPEVVTLDGQNVEFVAGAKIPFQLGQNVIQGDNNNIQQFFYKHVGTMVSVTPRIVNYGLYGEGQGERPIMAQDVIDWPRLVEWLLGQTQTKKVTDAKYVLDRLNLQPHGAGIPPYLVPFSDQTEVLKAVNDFSRTGVMNVKAELFGEKIIECPECDHCHWKPEDCTIDLTVVVRLSDAGKVDIKNPDNTITAASTEDNVRAVSNVIQVKSGNGVVMAGLIGDRETQELAKVPVLGDLPLVGFFFRNKVVVRQKTEVLIFVEAKVLDSNPCVARGESGNDFALGQPFINGGVLDNPLEEAFWRVGFGTYLPPHFCGEDVYWERFGRDVRDACTHTDDILK